MTRRSDELRRQLEAMLESEARQEATYGVDAEVGSTLTLVGHDRFVVLVRREQYWVTCYPSHGNPPWWHSGGFRVTWGDLCDQLDRLPDDVRIFRSVEMQEVNR